MAEPGSGGHNASQNNVVFVDTSLDTHLALLVSDSDTVSDLKKKILYEHPLCFPNVGKIQIHALKVKRKGFFYHLSDSMLVKSAFDGVKNNWFLGVDASQSVEHGENQHSHIPNSNDLLACFGIKNSTLFDRVDLLCDGPLNKPSNLADSSLRPVRSYTNAKDTTPKVDYDDSSNSGRQVLKEKDASDHGFGKDALQQYLIVPENSLTKAVREVSFDMRRGIKETPDEPCRSSSANTSKRKVSKTKSTNNLGRQAVVTGELGNCITNEFKNDFDVQANKLSEEASESIPHGKRKHKIENENGDQGPLKENGALTCDSNKETSKAVSSASQHSVADALRINGMSDNIRVAPLEDAHLLETGSTSVKSKKRRNKSSNLLNQVVAAAPPSGKVVGEEISGVTVRNKYKDSSGEPGAVSVPREGGATISETGRISMKEKEGDPIHEVEENNELRSSLMDKQKTNATLDGLASVPSKNVHLLGIDSSSGKKKRKKKSSKPLTEVVSAVPSSGKDDKEESSRVTVGINMKDSSNEPHAAGDSGQGAMTSELRGILQDEMQYDPFYESGENDKVAGLDMSDTDAGNVKKLSDLQKDIELSSRPENTVLNDDGNCKTDDTDGVERERASSHNRDPKGIMSEKVKPLSQDKVNINAKEVIATTKLLDETVIVGDRRSGKKGKKKRKTEDSVGGTLLKSGIEQVKYSDWDRHTSENGDHSSVKANKEESNSRTEEEVSRIKAVSTSLLGTGQKTGDVHGNELESLQHITKRKANAENEDEKMRKKSKKKRNSTTKDQDVDHKDATPSADNQKKVEASSRMINEKQGCEGISRDGNSSTIQLPKDGYAKHMLDPEKKLLKVSRSKDSVGRSLVKSGIKDAKNSEHDTSSADRHKTGSGDHFGDKAKKEGRNLQKGKEVSKMKTDGTSLLGTGQQSGDVHGDEVDSVQHISKTQANGENMEEKMRKKPKKKKNSTAKNLLGSQTKDQDVGHKDSTPSADNQRTVEASSKMTNEKQGSGGKSQADKSSTTLQLQGSLPNDEGAEHTLNPEKKLLKVSRIGRNDSQSPKSHESTSVLEDARRSKVDTASVTSINSERKSAAFIVSNSKLGNSKYIVHPNKLGNGSQSGVGQGVRKANDIGEVVNSSEHEKSLLAKSGAIFKDDRSYESKMRNGGGRSIKKGSSSGAKGMTLDTILRSSSRYKKAKQTADQSQLEETESQRVDFVPDSLADL
ncbi:hypothetical protein CJ030_MR0G004688 [Morella rubra]|uniref:Uncharacterized protein n=1 Tax=Morella rubra TaxID=262757 RepID=A0A6A1UN58_9ROSI|nr:hypothetical protein CJ030_MR0G004688 [Morella rubra]